MDGKGTDNILDLLARVLQVEYRIIVHYPALATMVPDEEARNIVLAVGLDSIRHADAVASIMRSLGREPPFPGLDPRPDLPLKETFRRQLEYEKLALMLHTKAGEMVPIDHQKVFQRLVEQEQVHIEGITRVLEKLSSYGSTVWGRKEGEAAARHPLIRLGR